MSAEAAIAAFPRRPLKLVETRGRKVGRIFLSLLSLAIALPALWWTVSAVQERQLYADLSARGVTVPLILGEGDCYSVHHRLTNTRDNAGCDLTISYRTAPEQGGRVLHTRLSTSSRPNDFEPEVRYDPQAPERALLASQLEEGQPWKQYVVAGLLWILAALPLALWFAIAKRGLARAAREPRAVAVQVTDVVRVMPQKMLHVDYVTPGGRKGRGMFEPPELPLMIPAPAGAPPGTRWALALEGRKGRAYLLDEALAWLDLTVQERIAVQGGIRALGHA